MCSSLLMNHINFKLILISMFQTRFSLKASFYLLTLSRELFVNQQTFKLQK